LLNQSSAPLLEALWAFLRDDHVPFYLPGHKRGQSIDRDLQALLGENLFRLDLPELPGLDREISDAEELAAIAYGVDRTWFLVNGSTCGIAASVLAVCQLGDKILLGRNCHKSAIAALVLSGAVPVYLPTEFNPRFELDCGVTPATLQETLIAHPDAKAVMLVSPNYFGVCGELDQIVSIAHAKSIPVLIDEAHGSHLHFHPQLPMSAVDAGADLVVQSTHKVTSSLTQTSMLHWQGDLVDRVKVSQALNLVQSSSPNLILLTSLDVARRQMAIHGYDLIERTLNLAATARSNINQISGLSSFDSSDIPNLDPTRLTVSFNQLGITGFAVDRILQQLGVIAEMPTLSQLVFAISIGNTELDIEKLVQALSKIQDHLPASANKGTRIPDPYTLQPIIKLSPREAFFAKTDRVAFSQSIGRICTEMLCPYPPGIPVICPGELITSEIVEFLSLILQAGGEINGCSDRSLETIRVIS